MADSGAQILDGSTFSAWGQQYPSLTTFAQYLDVLNEYRTDLSLCGVDFTSLPGTDKDSAYWIREYRQEHDINLKAFRDNAAALQSAATQAQAQLDLIAQTVNLQHYWHGNAADAALTNYLTNSATLDQDRAHLVSRAHDVAQVARNLEATLTSKATDASTAVGNLVNTLGNNVEDFETRLRTAIDAMKANNQGGSGPFGLGTNQHRYIHHGGSGDNWSAADVRKDIQNTVISAFGYTFNALDKSDYATEEHVRANYQTLLQALDDHGGPTDTPTPQTPGTPPQIVTLAELTQIYPHLDRAEAERFLPHLNRAMANAGATTPQAKAAFLATFGVETSELQLWREGEYVNSDGSRGYATSDAEFDQRYAGINGNIHPHDGSLFKGRGPIQLTGRANYQQFNDWYNATHPVPVDFMAHPELLEDRVNHPEYGFAAAEHFWASRDLTAAANQGGIEAVTDIVNRGDPNLQEKIDYYQRALEVFGG